MSKRAKEAEAALEKRAADAKAKKVSRRSDTPETDSSPKRQGGKGERK